MKKLIALILSASLFISLAACGSTSTVADSAFSSASVVDAITVSNGAFSSTPQGLIDTLNSINTDSDKFPQIEAWEYGSKPVKILGESLTLTLYDADNGKLSMVKVYFYDGDNGVSSVNKAGYLIGDLLKLFVPKDTQKLADKIDSLVTARSGQMEDTSGDVSVSFRTYGQGGNEFVIQPK